MKTKKLIRTDGNLTPYDLDCFKKLGNEILIKNEHYFDNGIALDIKHPKSYKLNRKNKKYRIILNVNEVIELNYFDYIRFSWLQKATWIQQRSRLEYAITTIILLTGIILATIF